MRYYTLATFLFRQSNTRPLVQSYRHVRPCTAFQSRHLQTATEPMRNRTRSGKVKSVSNASSKQIAHGCLLVAAPLETYDNTTALYDDPHQRAVVKHLNKLWHLVKDCKPYHNSKDDQGVSIHRS